MTDWLPAACVRNRALAAGARSPGRKGRERGPDAWVWLVWVAGRLAFGSGYARQVDVNGLRGVVWVRVPGRLCTPDSGMLGGVVLWQSCAWQRVSASFVCVCGG